MAEKKKPQDAGENGRRDSHVANRSVFKRVYRYLASWLRLPGNLTRTAKRVSDLNRKNKQLSDHVIRSETILQDLAGQIEDVQSMLENLQAGASNKPIRSTAVEDADAKGKRKAHGRISDVAHSVAKIEATMSDIQTGFWSKSGLMSQLYIVNKRLQDIQRYDMLDRFSEDFPDNAAVLASYRRGLSSQNGEDGMIYELIRRIGNPTKKCVEMCCGDNGGNSGFLVFELGWSGLLVDSNELLINRLKSLHTYDPERVKIRDSWITKENVNDLIKDAGLDGEIDMLSVDLDGVDYWIWKEIEACSPRIVVAEYNSSFGPDRSVTVPYQFDFQRPKDFRIYFGASLAALAKLGAEKGYRLIGIEPRGVNAVFVRNDLLSELSAVTPEQAWRLLDKHDMYLAKKKVTDIFGELQKRGLPVIDV